MARCPFKVLVLSVVAVSLLGGPRLRGQAFDCVILDDDNTNIFVTPADCFNLPQNAEWCSCVRSLFTHPVKGEASGFNQAVEWIVDQPGIGNHRVEVEAGTLDVSGLQVGDVIGETLIDELIPGSGGLFFRVRSEIKITAVSAGSVDFDVNVVEVSPAAIFILEYNPTDACHSNGHFYSGRLTSHGPGAGFTLEYRYPKEDITDGQVDCTGDATPDSTHAAIELGDVGSPGFTVRFLYKYFTTETGVYTLPEADTAGVTTTLRRFSDNASLFPLTTDEILDLGAEDLCLVQDDELADQAPCKVIDEVLQVKNSLEENSPPTAAIVMLLVDLDAETIIQLFDPAEVQMACDQALVLFRGGNSDDGDGGLQQLSYEWSILEGPEGGAVIPEVTRNFQDTEITFTQVGTYVIGVRVDDGQAANNTDETSVTVEVRDDFNFNNLPTAIIITIPDPPEVELVDGAASLTLDGSQSANGFPGEDDCEQELAFTWRQLEGPVAAEIVAPDQAVTEVRFNTPGTYLFELEVDDGAAEDNTDTEQVEVTVTGRPAQPFFRRGDTDARGDLTLTDGVYVLRYLFSGGPAPPCLDSADSDDNGGHQLTDGVYVLRYLFTGGPAPPSPGPDTCGPDPTEDGLDCQEYAHCP